MKRRSLWGSYRIITAGDSHTFGHFVNTEENYPEKLENKLIDSNDNGLFCENKNKIEVINLGMMGYDAEYTIQRIKEDGIKYDPDAIIWYFKVDDFTEILKQMVPRIKKMQDDLIKENPRFADDPTHAYDAWIQASKELRTSLGIRTIIDYNYKLIEKYIQETTLPIIFLTYSNDERANSFLIPLKEKFPHTRVFSGFSSEEIERLPDGHPSSSGYTYLVQILSNYLLENQNWLCPN